MKNLKITASLILFILLQSFVIKCYAQKKISITLSDIVTKQPVVGARLIFNNKINLQVFNGITNDKGNLEIGLKESQIYILEVFNIGYVNYRDSIILNNDTTLNIFLTPASINLKEVKVIGKRGIIYKPDRMIYYVDQDNDKTKTVTDLLRNVPFVSVTTDKLLIKGNNNYQMLKNGIATTLSVNELSAMSSSRIQSIEVITAPSAKYEGQYENVLNINFKRNDNFIGGDFYTRAGTRNSGIDGNYTKTNEKVNTTITGNLGYDRLYQGSDEDRYISKDTIFNINQKSNSYQKNPTLDLSYNTEFALSKEDYLGFTAKMSGTKNNLSSVYETTINPLSVNIISDNTTDTKSYNIGFEANYLKKINKNNKLSFSNMLNLNNGVYQLNSLNNNQTVNLSNNNYNREYTTQADNETTIKNGLIEAGGKFIYRRYLQYPKIDNTPEELFKFTQMIFASYFSIAKKYNKFYIRLGTRLEKTVNKFDDSNLGNRLNLLPNILLTYRLNPNNSFKLSYRQSINRPSYILLSTFINRGTPLSETTGNPDLKNEAYDRISLVNDFTIGSNDFSIELIYKNGRNVVGSQNIVNSYNTNITFGNLSNSNTFTTNINYSRALLKDKLYLNLFCTVGYSTLSGFGLTNSGFINSFSGGGAYNINNKLSVEFFANYLENAISLQKKTGNSIFMDTKIRYGLNKSTFSLQFTNPFFDKINENYTVIAPFLLSNGNNYYYGRNIAIGYSFSFGRTKDASQQTKKAINNDLIDENNNKKL